MLSRTLILVNMVLHSYGGKLNVVFGLQAACRETAHGQPVQKVERELAGSVVTAGQRKNLMRQFQLPEAAQDLLRIHRQKRSIVFRPNQKAA